MKIRQTKRIDDNGNEIYLSYDDYGDLNSEVWEEDGIYSAKIHTPDGVKKIHLTEEDGKRMIEIARESYNEEQKESRRHVSLDALDPEERLFAMDIVDPLEKEAKKEMIALHTEAMEVLTPKQKEIITEVFWRGKKGSEIAGEKGVNPSVIYRQLESAYSKMREYIKRKDRE